MEPKWKLRQKWKMEIIGAINLISDQEIGKGTHSFTFRKRRPKHFFKIYFHFYSEKSMYPVSLQPVIFENFHHFSLSEA